ncbi:MAG TPA: methionine adenosyltransferase [Acidimicrobiia bacterium]|nr:methionine adenosyltransferase [Acidimicrobiia bacterium]
MLFTSESVTEGHPDKLADQISDTVLDSILVQDPFGRVACETLLTTGLVVVAGEITTNAYVDIAGIARSVICEAGYDSDESGFDGNACGVMVAIDEQSPEISSGVTTSLESRDEFETIDMDNSYETLGAGDQGLMFGYACNETPDLMPLPIWWAHRITKQLAEVRKTGELSYLRPDGKAQVTINYENGIPVSAPTIVVSTQTEPGVEADKIESDVIERVIRATSPANLDLSSTRFLINPTGSFVLGGPRADSGLTGRKIIVDTYGGYARHGGGAFSGKDSTKVDRSAAYAARAVAKSIVAAGLADKCEIQLAYAIGVARPVSTNIETFGTCNVDEKALDLAVAELFDLRPGAIIDNFNLRTPRFRPTATYGHFGRSEETFTWERVDLYIEELTRHFAAR